MIEISFGVKKCPIISVSFGVYLSRLPKEPPITELGFGVKSE
jgi:hypothetical protein